MDKEQVNKPKVEMIPHEIEEVYDDRLEEVEIVYGPKPIQYISEILPKKQALEKLVAYYQNSGGKVVPKNRANLGDGLNLGQKVNQDTVYMKFTKWDVKNGKELVVVKDVPIWIAADRIVNSGELGGWRKAEMISEAEHANITSKKESDTEVKNYKPTSFYKRV